MKRMVSFSRQWSSRIVNFVKRVVKTLVGLLKRVAEFPKSLGKVAETLGWLQVSGMLSSLALSTLQGVMASLIEIGPKIQSLFSTFQTLLIAVGVAIGEGVEPHVETLNNLMIQLMNSPILDWLSMFIDSVLGSVIPALQRFVDGLSGLTGYMPSIEELSTLFGNLANKIVDAALAFLQSLLPLIPQIVSALTGLADVLREHAGELAPALVDVFKKVCEALEAIIPVIPEIETALAEFNKACANIFSTLYDRLGPQLLAMMLAINMLGPVVTVAASVFDALGNIVASLPQIFYTCSTAVEGLGAVMTFLATNPVGMLVAAIGGTIIMLQAFTMAAGDAVTPIGWLIDKISGLLDWLQQLGQAVMERLQPHLQELSKAFSDLIAPIDEATTSFGQDQTVINTLADLIAAVLIPSIKTLTMTLEASKPIIDLIAAAIEALHTAIDAIAKPIDKMYTAWENALNKMKEVYDNTIGPILDKIEGFCESIGEFFEKLREKLVGGSIWTDTWRQIGRVTEWRTMSAMQTISHFTSTVSETFRRIQPIEVSAKTGRLEVAETSRRVATFPRPVNVYMTFENVVLSEELDFERFLDEVSSRVASAVRGVSA